MELNECISHCKSMVNQHNQNRMMYVIEVESVHETHRNRDFRKDDVWNSPHGDQQIAAICVADTMSNRLSGWASGGSGLKMHLNAEPNEIGIVFKDRHGTHRAVMVTAMDNSWSRVTMPDPSWFNTNLPTGSNVELDKPTKKEETEGDRLMRFFASSQHDPSNPWYNPHERK